MSDSDWDQVLSDIDHLMGGGTAGQSAMWQAFEDGYDEDMTIVSLAEGATATDWNGDLENGDEIRQWINNARDDASSAAVAFGDTWRTKIRPDVVLMNSLKTSSEAWTDDVYTPVRNEPGSVRNSGVLQSWYGPGAQKYAAAVMEQAAAMDEMNAMVQGAASGLQTTANLVKNVALLMLHSLQPIYDKLSGWPKHGYGEEHDDDMIFGERTAYGKGQFEGLRDWLNELVDGGEWKNQTDQVTTSFEDLKVNSVAFKANTWPQAVTDGMGDMNNGNAGLGDQANQPGSQPPGGQPPEATSTEPDPDAPGTTTVNEDGGIETNGSGAPGGDDQYEGDDYTGVDRDGDESTHGTDTHYSNIDE